MNRYIGFVLLALAVRVLDASTHGNLEEATCPPARFISCGLPPSGVVCPGMAGMCCWVVTEDGATVNANWGVEAVSADALLGPQYLGIPEGAPIMSAEFDTHTRVMVNLRCTYYAVDKCAGGAVTDGVEMFSLVSFDPSRYRVTEDVAVHTIRETTANPDEYVCQCSNKDALIFPERYRCCYWDSGAGEVAHTRMTTCRAPIATPDPAASDCNRIVRPVSQCGDAGGCYCRFEYVPLASAATREPWDCGKCCPALTGIFGRDLVEKHNNTRANCLDSALAFRLPGDNACEDRGLFRSLLPAQSSGARVVATVAAGVIAFFVPALWDY